jgi:hypothetical protein
MTEYRIVELHRRFHIEKLAKGNSWDSWIALNEPHVPRFFETLADARSWVAIIKKGVVYHDAEDAPNLAQDERKAEDDTSDGIKSLEWFMERLDRTILRKTFVKLQDEHLARACYDCQIHNGYRYSDPC